jgi:hypothetical protein
MRLVAPRRSKLPRVLGALLSGVCALPGAAQPSEAGVPASLGPVDAVVLATPHDPDARRTEVRAVHVERGALAWRVLGSVTHAPGAVVRGDFAGGGAWVVADEEGARDPDWGAALYRVDAHGVVRALGSVGHARRPLAAGGAVYVERGASGPLPSAAEVRAGRLRLDHVSIDAVDAATLARRHVYDADVYALHLAGEHAGELVVYRVDPAGTSLVAVDERTGAARTIRTVAPFARDFSIDGGSVVFSDRDAAAWTVERVDLAAGTDTRLETARAAQPAALAFGGRLAWSAEGRRGLAIDGRVIAPLGAGFDAPEMADPAGAWLAVLHVGAGFDHEALVDVARGRAVRLDQGERVTVIALGGAGGGRR